MNHDGKFYISEMMDSPFGRCVALCWRENDVGTATGDAEAGEIIGFYASTAEAEQALLYFIEPEGHA